MASSYNPFPSQWPVTAPRNVQELIDRVPRDRCTCTPVKCIRSDHRTLSYDLRSSRFPPQPTRDFDAMYLAQEAIRSFDMPLNRLKKSQREAVAELAELLERKGRAKDNHLRKLAWTNASKNVRNQDMAGFVKIFNKVFFLDSVVPDFVWHNLDNRLGECCYGGDERGNVSLIRQDSHRTNLRDDSPDIRREAVSRLGTLLHEAAHAFFQQYACWDCSNVNVDGWAGHGKAWQSLAVKLEEKALEFWGLPLDLNRFRTIQNHWDFRTFPCFHDLDRWRLKDDRGMGITNRL